MNLSAIKSIISLTSTQVRFIPIYVLAPNFFFFLMCTFYSFSNFGTAIGIIVVELFIGMGFLFGIFFFFSELQTHNFKYLQGTFLNALWL